MSGIFARAFGYREFLGEDAIKDWVERKLRAVAREWYRDMAARKADTVWRAMLIFATSTQQTWIITSSLTTCLVQDDLRKEDPSTLLISRTQDALPIRVEPDKGPATGMVYIGQRPRGWYYSKKLFADRDPAEAITNFLTPATTTTAA